MMHHLLMSNSQSIVHIVIISGSVKSTRSIETAKYFVLNAEFRYKSVHDPPFIDGLFTSMGGHK